MGFASLYPSYEEKVPWTFSWSRITLEKTCQWLRSLAPRKRVKG